MTLAHDKHPKLLAYIGDAVYELWIREAFIEAHHDPEALHQQVVSLVKAERQAQVLHDINEHLPEDLKALAKRARNVTSPPKGRKISQQAYRDATALEAIIGYCHLYDPSALITLKSQILSSLEIH